MKAILSVLILYFLLLLTTASFAQGKPSGKKIHTVPRLATALYRAPVVEHTSSILNNPNSIFLTTFL